MKSYTKIMPVLAVVVLLLGCRTHTVMATGGKRFPRTNPYSVKLYLENKPTTPYVVIGRVGVNKHTIIATSRSGGKIYERLRKNAASIGGDAIIDIKEDWESISGVVIKMSSKKNESAAIGEGGQLYTAYNIRYEKPSAIGSTGYLKGEMIPAGTKVKDTDVRFKSISFKLAESGENFKILFNPKHNPGISTEDIAKRLFTSKSFDELMKGFSQKEIECVKEGVVKPGVRKEAVLVTYGYPPEVRTSSLDDLVWTYWTDTRKTMTIYFDEKGVVKEVED